MTVSSAPGKVYLFGEHAVVYGEPAIPCAIERRATVSATPRSDDHVRLRAEDLSLNGITIEYDGSPTGRPDVAVPDRLIEAAFGYVNESVKQARAAVDRADAGFDITIESDLPLGAGLGSSAAVTVAAIDAATRAHGVTLEPSELAERAYQTESTVQDGQASRADTFCSTMGGAVRVEGNDCRRLDVPDLPIVIGWDGGAGETGELVAGVRRRRERYGCIAEIIGTIGNLVREGETALAAGDRSEIGTLMDANHGLLSALGVSSPSLDEMVWAARDAGATGAKLTGAGGGGCMVALDESERTVTALAATPVCSQAFRADLATSGVRREDDT